MFFKMPCCGGCRTCVMACSYHHHREFNPAVSSLVVHEKKMGEGYDIELVETGDGQRMACDGCKDLDEPLCVAHCEENEELEKILKEFLLKRKQ